MQITQTVNPFKRPGTASNSNVWILFVVFGIFGAIGYYFYRKNQISMQNSGLL